MAKSPSQKNGLVDAVKASLAVSRPGFLAWHQRVAAEHQDELVELKRQWQAGELGTQLRPVAKLISQELEARGIASIGIQGVQTWLKDR